MTFPQYKGMSRLRRCFSTACLVLFVGACDSGANSPGGSGGVENSGGSAGDRSGGAGGGAGDSGGGTTGSSKGGTSGNPSGGASGSGSGGTAGKGSGGTSAGGTSGSGGVAGKTAGGSTGNPSGGSGGKSSGTGGTGGAAGSGGTGPVKDGGPDADTGTTTDVSTRGVGGNGTGGVGGQTGGAGGQTNPDASPATGGSGGSTAFNPCPTNGDACKILPLGDSITHGVQSSDSAGYRSQLFKLVVAASQKVTFVGSQSSGPSQVSGQTFPKKHEGHDGWTVDPGYSEYGSGGISSLVPSPAFSDMPGIVLLMIGTNDITSTSSPGTTADRLDGLLDKIVKAAPDALLVVAKLTPVSWNSADLDNYNAKIPSLVQARAAKGQHIVSVDMSKMPKSSLAGDGVHPNDQGYSYMADVWYAAIKDVLPK
jgi:lysophospholipase L1-like esterase